MGAMRRSTVVFFILYTLFVTTSPARADVITVAWDPSISADVAGYIVYVGLEPGVYVAAFDAGNSSLFTYADAAPGQLYYFAVAAYAPGPVAGMLSQEISGYSNRPPVIETPASQAGRVGDQVVLQLAGSDPEGHPVTYAASGLPPGLALTESTGFISGTVLAAGTFGVTVSVTDGALSSSASFLWTVVADGAAPSPDVPTDSPPMVIIGTPTSESVSYTHDSVITIAGTAHATTTLAAVTWSNRRGGAGVAIGTTDWKASIPLRPGVNPITVTVTDAIGRTATASITVFSNAASK